MLRLISCTVIHVINMPLHSNISITLEELRHALNPFTAYHYKPSLIEDILQDILNAKERLPQDIIDAASDRKAQLNARKKPAFNEVVKINMILAYIAGPRIITAREFEEQLAEERRVTLSATTSATSARSNSDVSDDSTISASSASSALAPDHIQNAQDFEATVIRAFDDRASRSMVFSNKLRERREKRRQEGTNFVALLEEHNKKIEEYIQSAKKITAVFTRLQELSPDTKVPDELFTEYADLFQPNLRPSYDEFKQKISALFAVMQENLQQLNKSFAFTTLTTSSQTSAVSSSSSAFLPATTTTSSSSSRQTLQPPPQATRLHSLGSLPCPSPDFSFFDDNGDEALFGSVSPEPSKFSGPDPKRARPDPARS